MNFVLFSVRMKGLEPPRPEAQDPKSCAATNYATSAGIFFRIAKIQFFNLLQPITPFSQVPAHAWIREGGVGEGWI